MVPILKKKLIGCWNASVVSPNCTEPACFHSKIYRWFAMSIWLFTKTKAFESISKSWMNGTKHGALKRDHLMSLGLSARRWKSATISPINPLFRPVHDKKKVPAARRGPGRSGDLLQQDRWQEHGPRGCRAVAADLPLHAEESARPSGFSDCRHRACTTTGKA